MTLLIYYYNKLLMEGKWDQILTPEKFPPPVVPMYPDAQRSLHIGNPALEYTLWGNLPEIIFESAGEQTKWIELYNTGMGILSYSISSDSPDCWINIDHPAGTFIGEKRILLTVNLNALPSENNTMQLRISCCEDNSTHFVSVKYIVKKFSHDHPKFALEYDNAITIYADEFYSADSSDISIIPGLARMAGNLVCIGNITMPVLLSYRFRTYSNGCFLMELTRYLTLRSKGNIQFAYRIDNLQEVTVSSPTTDEWRGNWKNAVMHDGEKICTRLPYLESGDHTITLMLSTPYFSFSQITIYTGKQRPNDLGPHLNHLIGSEAWYSLPVWDEKEYLPNEIDIAKKQISSEWLLPPLIYAGKSFYQKDPLYMKNEAYTQYPGFAKYLYATGIKKDILAAFGNGTFLENDGVLAIEAEYVLCQNSDASYAPDAWRVIKAPTNGNTGFAMQATSLSSETARPDSSSLNYRICISHTNCYHVWLLMKFNDDSSDSCHLAVDDHIYPSDFQYSKGHQFTYSTQQVWFWSLVESLEISSGTHIFQIYADKSCIRIDRIYITSGSENPPDDYHWKESSRQK